jgi:hypothetical protein
VVVVVVVVFLVHLSCVPGLRNIQWCSSMTRSS